ncbi:MAG: putative addiction module antidote protein [Holophagales bacterium]|jgi:probable addiction module antidote protein|nr:putative addiction module antidote protein [Holophagales bacterium]
MVTFRRFNILESLDTEEEIKEFLEGVRQDIEEGECDASFFAIALADAAKARTINQLAKETGIGRLELCGMFAQGGEAPPPSLESMARVTKAFAVHAHAGA